MAGTQCNDIGFVSNSNYCNKTCNELWK